MEVILFISIADKAILLDGGGWWVYSTVSGESIRVFAVNQGVQKILIVYQTLFSKKCQK